MSGQLTKQIVLGHLSIADNVFDAMGHSGPGGYNPGWCGFHAVQYQKLNPNDPSSHYHFDIAIKDAKGNVIGTVGMVDAPANQGFSVGSRLPSLLIVTAQNVDNDGSSPAPFRR